MFEYGFSLIFINILIYLLILILIFSIFLSLNIDKIQILSEIKYLNNHMFFLIIFILSLLSLAGMPPLVGFAGKFLLLMFIALTNNYLFFFIIVVTNLFMLYFYIQNIRFIISKNSATTNVLNNHKPYLDFKLLNIVIFINTLNIFGIFLIEDLYLIINTITMYISS